MNRCVQAGEEYPNADFIGAKCEIKNTALLQNRKQYKTKLGDSGKHTA